MTYTEFKKEHDKLVTAIGGAIGAGVFYAFVFVVLAMEPIQ